MSGGGSNSGSLADYEPLEEIGSGSYGTCVKIRRLRDGAILVWKELSYATMTDAEKRYLCSEVNLLKSLNHPNIVKYVDRIHDRETGKVYIIMEYCEGGDLLKRIRSHREERKFIDEAKIWKWLTQLALALRCCHCRQGVKAVLHRDLKPANCFLDADDNLKLGDFGLARVLRNSASFASTFVGTPYYMSPEQMQKSAYTEKSDIWSLGIVAYELACLRPPFVADKQRELAARIKRGEFDPLPDRYGPGLKSLVADCLTVREDLRPSVEDLLGRAEMRDRIPGNEAPEASLGRWADQLRALSDALTRREESSRRAELRWRREADAARAELQRASDEADSLRAELRAREQRVRARERAVAESEARLAARERALAGVERALEAGQARLRVERLKLSREAVASESLATRDASTSTEKGFRPDYHESPTSTTPAVAAASPGLATQSQSPPIRSGIRAKPPLPTAPVVAMATNAAATKSVSFAAGPPEVRPIPAPRRSVLRDQGNCDTSGIASASCLGLLLMPVGSVSSVPPAAQVIKDEDATVSGGMALAVLP